MASPIRTLAQKFGFVSSRNIGEQIEWAVNDALARRKPHERRWYDNNFFDDGYHFRTVSRKTGSVIDHTARNSQYVERAIPRASRQIRSIANLLFAAEPYPVVYPQRITKEDFQDFTSYQAAVEENKKVARKQGVWLDNEWIEQELNTKMLDLILLAAKNSVSWLQVYSDTDKEKIITTVYDAFDVICYGDLREPDELPFMTKSCPMDLAQAMTDDRFDPKAVARLAPDNKYATSPIKNAYMTTRYGQKDADPKKGTLMINETFMRDYLTDDNWDEAIKLAKNTGALEGKSKGDSIMRHIFSAGPLTLRDEYVDYDRYPLVPYRFEPGPIYQVPFIERFIPQNKSIDIIVTRLEKWVNAMVVGVYQVRKGENISVSNFPGGQKIEYEGTPLSQMQMSTVSSTPFQVLDLLNKFMDEQGATTAGGQNLPAGVKSGVAIESIKATEYANLKISTLMLKQTLKQVAERMLERADKDYVNPKEVSTMSDGGEAEYFDVIGARGEALSKKLKKKLPSDMVVLHKDLKVRIEMEPGLGLTMEGKKQAMKDVMETLMNFNKVMPGSIQPNAFLKAINKFLEQYGYGSTQELMEDLEEGMTEGDPTDEQILKLKIAIVEALKESGAVGPQAEQRLVDSTKLGVLQTLKDTGLADMAQQGTQAPPVKGPSESISFKDLPPEGQAQMAQQAGIHLSPDVFAAHAQQQQQADALSKAQDLQLKREELAMKERHQATTTAMKMQEGTANRTLKEKQLSAQQKQAKSNGVKK